MFIIPGALWILLIEKEIILLILFSINKNNIFLGLLLVNYSILLFLNDVEINSSGTNKLLLILSKFWLLLVLYKFRLLKKLLFIIYILLKYK
jgi:hypothetical protein